MFKLTFLRLFVFSVLLAVLSVQNLSAQTETAPKRGVYLNGSYSMSDFETINNTNGNVMFNLPLASLPAGRGGMSYGMSLSYNSKLFDVITEELFEPPPGYEGVVKRVWKSETAGWRYGIGYTFEQKKRPYVPEFHSNTQEICHSAANPDYKYFDMYKFVLTLPDGSQKEFTPVMNFGGTVYDSANQDGYHSVDINGKYRRWSDIIALGNWYGCEINYFQYTGTMSFYTTDGSFLRLDVAHDNDTDWTNNPWTLRMPDGSRITQAAPLSGEPYGRQRIYDRNNNYVEIHQQNQSGSQVTEVTDELGRKLTVTMNPQTLEDVVSLKGVNNETLDWTIKWKNIYVSREYYRSEDRNMFPTPATVNAIFKTVEEIVLPAQLGGLSYKFEYNGDSNSNFSVRSTGFGEIARIEVPSGAAAEYEYKLDGTQSAAPEWKDVFLNPLTKKTLIYDETYDGQTVNDKEEVWLYDIDWRESAITAPDGGISKAYYFHLLEEDGYVYKSVSPDGTISQRIRVAYGPYTGSALLYLWQGLTAAEYTTIPAADGSPAKTVGKSYDYDMNGNRVRVREYDWLPVTPTLNQYGEPTGYSPIRTTETSYYNPAPEIRQFNQPNLDLTYLYTSSTAVKIKDAVKAVEIKDANSQVKSRTEFVYDDAANTGNPTQTRNWDSHKDGTSQAYSNPLTTTNSISTSAQYDAYGNPTLTTDARGYQTQITYASINGYTGLYPTQIKAAYNTAIERTSTMAYDFYTGLIISTTDVDNNLTSGTEYDAIGRPLKSKAAVGTAQEIWTQTEYNDTLRRVITRSDLFVKGDGKKIAVQHTDQLGRVRLTRQIENAATENPYNEEHGIKVQTRYLTGNPYSYQVSSNPYRAATSGAATGEPSMGWTRSKSWNTGKHSETENFAGATLPAPFAASNPNTNSTGIVRTDADAERTLVTDQAGKQRISRTNALGQLTDVWEITTDTGATAVSFPNQTLATGYQTSYEYDTLNNLKKVIQGTQQTTRTFTYSSLSRLISAANPESGTIGYQYDAGGNLTRKTDARSIQTNYTYDALNRVTLRDYSDSTPDVAYTYDNLTSARGKLTKVSSSVSETEYTAFDIAGRVLSHKQTTDGQSYTTGYVYNLSGGLVEQTYPSGRVVKNVLDADGELEMVQSKKNAYSGFFDYAKNFTYTAAGAVSSMQLGNGKWESTVFNSRLQPTQIALGTVQNGTDKLKLDFSYGTTQNNGNVQSQTITVPTTGQATGFAAVQTYAYDSLNRLKSATENIDGSQTPSWKQTFTYDRYGNRNFDTTNTTTLGSCPASQCNPTIDVSNNRFTSGQGYTYDLSGNITADAQGRTFTFDGENKQTKVVSGGSAVGEYFYDGDGKRVKKIAETEVTIFVYNASGQLVAEYSTQISQTPQVSYLTADHLGSPRINTDANGNILARHDYQPFGEEITSSQTAQRNVNLHYAADDVRQKFTSYERDNESDLDFAEARMYNFQHGRFTAVDPLLESAEPALPQTWNRYVYCLNNPLNLIDPDGQKWEFVGNDKVKAEELKKAFEAAVKAQGEKAWKAYQAIEKAGGVIKVGFGELGKNQFGLTSITGGKVDAKNNLTELNGSITISNKADALDISNFTDLATASGHEFEHVTNHLASSKVKGFVGLSPNDGLTPKERSEGKLDSFPEESAAFTAQIRAEKAAIAEGNKPLTPGTALERSTRGFEKATTPQQRYDALSDRYNFKQSRPGAQPAKQTTNRVNKKP